jgi:hypothetical protein
MSGEEGCDAGGRKRKEHNGGGDEMAGGADVGGCSPLQPAPPAARSCTSSPLLQLLRLVMCGRGARGTTSCCCLDAGGRRSSCHATPAACPPHPHPSTSHPPPPPTPPAGAARRGGLCRQEAPRGVVSGDAPEVCGGGQPAGCRQWVAAPTCRSQTPAAHCLPSSCAARPPCARHHSATHAWHAARHARLRAPAEAVPKKILELMVADGLTRENVASHLQVAAAARPPLARCACALPCPWSASLVCLAQRCTLARAQRHARGRCPLSAGLP